eukprot:GFUD01021229.1.p1 GENE.GFUD01021229.1~~GFUD01021229.1.p1  ORF type:complete len:431 (-),score=160.88 GFUD01021229.1:117-1409(-)
MTATDVATATTQAQSGKSSPNSKESSPVKVKTPAEIQEEIQEDATTHLLTGKRHLLVSDIPSAVTSLAQACELLSGHFGETAKECAESYFYYGKSLLELSRMESGVLGNALEGVPEGDDANGSTIEDTEKMTEEEKTNVEEEVGEAMEENFQSLMTKEENEAIGKMESKEETSKDEGSMDAEANGSKDVNMEGDDVEADDSQGEGTDTSIEGKESDEKKEGDEDEEPSNLQLAWEMLELAKVVYTKQVESGEGVKAYFEEKLCSTILSLGEVSIENENYSQAVEDIQSCIKKLESLPKDSRIIAEAKYQLGVAQGFNAQYDEAVESLNSAIEVIKLRTKNIKESVKSSKSPSLQKMEITELEALVPEIEEKIIDTKDMKKEAEAKTEQEAAGLSSTSGSKNVTSIAVKRKVEEEDGNNKKTMADKTAAAS